MSHLLFFAVFVALVIACFVLWYAVRTHKSVADLHRKYDTAIAPKIEAAKAEVIEAVEAEKAKL